MTGAPVLRGLQVGQLVPFGGNRVAAVPQALASAFREGDHLVVVQDDGTLLHIPSAEFALVRAAVDVAVDAFGSLSAADDAQISSFFDGFAHRLADDSVFAPIAAANAADVQSALSRGRSTTRLVLSTQMRNDMIAGLRVWRDTVGARDHVTEKVQHQGWTVTMQRAPLGVVGFVFEGRPNVFADATGVLRTRNTAVLRIGSDALGTARAIMRHALVPALLAAGLPAAAVSLVDSAARSTGWALFNDHRLSLAVARGSGQAVTQLGAVARQAGVPVSLHGTGGAWLVASEHADMARFRSSVINSLDRKVCNTLNVCCIVASRADELIPEFIDAVFEAARRRSAPPRLHIETSGVAYVSSDLFSHRVTVRRADGDNDEPLADVISTVDLSREWEWENSPELSLVVVDALDDAVALFNQFSPHLTASLISDDPAEQQWFYDRCDAPFIGDGFTRWVDGQFALNRPELGLSNWESGRLFGRSAVLSGDSVFTVRLRATVTDSELHR